MGLLEFIARLFDRILNAGVKLFIAVMNTIEGALRQPLQTIGIHGSLQTLILMMIPLMMIVAVVKLFGGIFRLLLLIVLILVLLHTTLPLFHGSGSPAP